MKSISIRLIGLLIIFATDSIAAQDSVVLRNKIAVQISITVHEEDSFLLYDYELKNGKGAEQSIWQFWLITSQNISIWKLRAPLGWDGTIGNVRDRDYSEINWGTSGDFDILPDSSLGNFSFISNSIPGIIPYYAEGYAPPPQFEPGMAPDFIYGYHDLTPYGPGIVGKTVGPVEPPDSFDPIAFIDNIISYKHQAYD